MQLPSTSLTLSSPFRGLPAPFPHSSLTELTSLSSLREEITFYSRLAPSSRVDQEGVAFGVEMLLGGEKLGMLICFTDGQSGLGIDLWITTAVCNSLTEKRERQEAKQVSWQFLGLLVSEHSAF